MVKEIFKNTKVIILLVCLVLAVVAINPALFGSEGVAIRSIARNSSAELAGIESPSGTSTPMSREVIKSVNNRDVSTVEEYAAVVSDLIENQTIQVRTDKDIYTLVTTQNGSIGVNVYDAPTSNIKKGLDLSGGTRVLLAPEEELSDEDMEMVISSMKQRLNVYGLSDIIIREAGDLPPPLGEGKQYIMVEVAGLTEEEVKDLLSKQGKFEAKIANETVFTGGNDITYVCRTSDCAGIDPQKGCAQVSEDTQSCRFRFTISLSKDAAERHANITGDLSVVTVDEENNPLPQNQQYLSEQLDFYLDDDKVDSLNIGSDLRGSVARNIQISGSGTGVTRANAIENALTDMKQMQTVLLTGSLPVELEIVKIDTISPALGKEFSKNVMIMGLFVILAVSAFIYVRYRTLKIVIPLAVTMISEIVLLLGMASLIGWNLDLAAVAGIIIAVGTGVDHQIVIVDESRKVKNTNWKKNIKSAFFIIMAAYFTTVVAMLPLWFAGAGILRGFAITTIAGVTFGVLITRPAFAKIIEILQK